jgi:UDP-glucuronate 4-epimerase
MNGKILITGAAGFIGRAVSERLLAMGEDLVLVDSLNNYYAPQLKRDRLNSLMTGGKVKFFYADITNQDYLNRLFSENDIKTVIHLAAQPGVTASMVDPARTYKTNVVGTAAVLDACQKYGVERIFYASSSSVYGAGTSSVKEHDQTFPSSNYALSKLTNEQQADMHHQSYGGTMVGMRFFTAYGPWGRPDMAYWLFTKAIMEDKPVLLRGIMTRRDFTYVDDLVDMVVGILDKAVPGTHEIYNLGSGRSISVESMIMTIGEILGKKPEIIEIDLPVYESSITRSSVDKLQSRIGYCKTTSMAEGLKNFVEWYKDYHK